ncbi:hypothetical protein EI77_03113 [Prosthecobacter fusiformis]|uniref:Uncharacterized protein n=1 Tax=Prosthecobacter fusiformis TaxID=48464 RepID=A0A4R7RWP7_9BACT|nr:hypothetical protein EI77_03113 [Prosthecobacter fusiformis]
MASLLPTLLFDQTTPCKTATILPTFARLSYRQSLHWLKFRPPLNDRQNDGTSVWPKYLHGQFFSFPLNGPSS